MSVDTIIWLALAAFLIGFMAGLMWEYGAATIEFVRVHG